MSKSLIQIAQDSAALEELLQETGGELTETLETFLDEIQTNLTTKSDSYASMMDHISITAELFRKKSEAYRAAAKSAENVVERMKERIHTTMDILGRDSIEGNSVRFKLQNSPPSLIVTDENAVPQSMKIITVTVDSAKIKASLKDGISVPGASLVQNKHVRKYLKK
jgi:hypothetical protein